MGYCAGVRCGMRQGWSFAAMSFVSALSFGACGGGEDSEERPASGTGTGETAAPPQAPRGEATLFEQPGELAASDANDPRGRYDDHFVDVGANDRVLVTLSSSAFDPILEVTPPGSGALVNDDWQGDTSRSQLELVAASAGSMRVRVRSYRPDGSGAYRLVVRRLAAADDSAGGGAVEAPVLSTGDTADGELRDGDHTLSSGELFDSFVVRTEGPARIAITPSGGERPRSTLVGPDGLTLQDNEGYYDASAAGTYRLQVVGARGLRYRVEVTNRANDAAPLIARAHHQFNEIMQALGGGGGTGPTSVRSGANPQPAPSAQAPAALPVRVGDRLTGNLSENDPRLPSGEHYDTYELTVAQPAGDVSIEMESAALDTFLRVDGPNGQHWENDDYGGTLNSRVELSLAQPGTYRIVTTSYQTGRTGNYELKVLARRDDPVANAASTPEQVVDGALAQGDTTLRTGEFFDEHRFSWPPGTRVHLEARSTEFDTYLIVHAPSGGQQDNDDMSPGHGLNAGLDLQVNEPGEWRVLVTSYRPGMVGRYQLAIGGGGAAPSQPQPQPQTQPQPQPQPPSARPSAGARTENGTLAQGDATLRTGEFQDVYPMTFTPRSAVSIRLESSDFDSYLIVRTPSGSQEDNDDLVSGNLNSGIDIPVAEPGTYQVSVTSYRPGETGRYTLTVSEGPSVVGAPVDPRPNTPNQPNTPAAPNGGGRVWGLFAGITDYPGGVNDLPECANDARKLAEALRQGGNMPADQEFLFVDGQATTANLRQAMQAIAQRIRPDDVFVFFYSGHGGQTERSTDTRELDARDEYLVLYDGELMDDEMGRLLDAMRSRISLVAIDACFAGGFSKDLITRAGRVGMFSSEEDVTSAVADRFQAGGYLSHFLRLGIQGEADNDPHNTILTVGELTHYTWVQFGRHASDVRMSMGYQHLVVDRGAVRTGEVLWAVR
jgi:hypothetical protein